MGQIGDDLEFYIGPASGQCFRRHLRESGREHPVQRAVDDIDRQVFQPRWRCHVAEHGVEGGGHGGKMGEGAFVAQAGDIGKGAAVTHAGQQQLLRVDVPALTHMGQHGFEVRRVFVRSHEGPGIPA